MPQYITEIRPIIGSNFQFDGYLVVKVMSQVPVHQNRVDPTNNSDTLETQYLNFLLD